MPLPKGLAAWQAARKAGGMKSTTKVSSMKKTTMKPKTVVKKKK